MKQQLWGWVLAALLLPPAAWAAPPPTEDGATTTMPCRRGLLQGLASADMGNVMLLGEEQRLMLDAIGQWYVEALFMIVEHVQDPAMIEPLLGIVELIVDDMIASILTPEQLALWDQFFPAGFGPGFGQPPTPSGGQRSGQAR